MLKIALLIFCEIFKFFKWNLMELDKLNKILYSNMAPPKSTNGRITRMYLGHLPTPINFPQRTRIPSTLPCAKSVEKFNGTIKKIFLIKIFSV